MSFDIFQNIHSSWSTVTVLGGFFLTFSPKNPKNKTVVWKPVATKVTTCLLYSCLRLIWSLPTGLPVSASYFWLGKKMTQRDLHLPLIQERLCAACLKWKVKKSDKGLSCLRLLRVIRGEWHQNILCASEVLFLGESFTPQSGKNIAKGGFNSSMKF